jgi:hypothetical protein
VRWTNEEIAKNTTSTSQTYQNKCELTRVSHYYETARTVDTLEAAVKKYNEMANQDRSCESDRVRMCTRTTRAKQTLDANGHRTYDV